MTLERYWMVLGAYLHISLVICDMGGQGLVLQQRNAVRDKDRHIEMSSQLVGGEGELGCSSYLQEQSKHHSGRLFS